MKHAVFLYHGGFGKFTMLKDINMDHIGEGAGIGFGEGFWLSDKRTVAESYAKRNPVNPIYVTKVELYLDIDDIILKEHDEVRSLSKDDLLNLGIRVVKFWETDLDFPDFTRQILIQKNSLPQT